MAKLLYVAKRARPDIDLTIAFLCTRVSKSTKENWEKLRRLLRYIHGSIDTKRTIRAENMKITRTWVDVSYATHEDSKSHTVGLFSLGRGIAHHSSSNTN